MIQETNLAEKIVDIEEYKESTNAQKVVNQSTGNEIVCSPSEERSTQVGAKKEKNDKWNGNYRLRTDGRWEGRITIDGKTKVFMQRLKPKSKEKSGSFEQLTIKVKLLARKTPWRIILKIT